VFDLINFPTISQIIGIKESVGSSSNPPSRPNTSSSSSTITTTKIQSIFQYPISISFTSVPFIIWILDGKLSQFFLFHVTNHEFLPCTGYSKILKPSSSTGTKLDLNLNFGSYSSNYRQLNSFQFPFDFDCFWSRNKMRDMEESMDGDLEEEKEEAYEEAVEENEELEELVEDILPFWFISYSHFMNLKSKSSKNEEKEELEKTDNISLVDKQRMVDEKLQILYDQYLIQKGDFLVIQLSKPRSSYLLKNESSSQSQDHNSSQSSSTMSYLLVYLSSHDQSNVSKLNISSSFYYSEHLLNDQNKNCDWEMKRDLECNFSIQSSLFSSSNNNKKKKQPSQFPNLLSLLKYISTPPINSSFSSFSSDQDENQNQNSFIPLNQPSILGYEEFLIYKSNHMKLGLYLNLMIDID